MTFVGLRAMALLFRLKKKMPYIFGAIADELKKDGSN